MTTTLVEVDHARGTCPIRGCISSKSRVHEATHLAAMDRVNDSRHLGFELLDRPNLDTAATVFSSNCFVDRLNRGVAGLLKGVKGRIVQDWRRSSEAQTYLVSTSGGSVSTKAQGVIFAAGSVLVELSHLPSSGSVVSSVQALSPTSLPGGLIFVATGNDGVELDTAYAKLGSKGIVFSGASGGMPTFDRQSIERVQRWLERGSVEVLFGARVVVMTPDRAALVVDDSTGKSRTIQVNAAPVNVGRRSEVQGWESERIGLELDGGSVMDDDRCATTTNSVGATGAVVKEAMLASNASAQGELVAESVARRRRRFDPAVIPTVCFERCGIGSVGSGPDGPGVLADPGPPFPFWDRQSRPVFESGCRWRFCARRRVGRRSPGGRNAGRHCACARIGGRFYPRDREAQPPAGRRGDEPRIAHVPRLARCLTKLHGGRWATQSTSDR